MLLNCILLALSVSIDSLGIGISYGIKHTKISKISNFTLFSISSTRNSFDGCFPMIFATVLFFVSFTEKEYKSSLHVFNS